MWMWDTTYQPMVSLIMQFIDEDVRGNSHTQVSREMDKHAYTHSASCNDSRYSSMHAHWYRARPSTGAS